MIRWHVRKRFTKSHAIGNTMLIDVKNFHLCHITLPSKWEMMNLHNACSNASLKPSCMIFFSRLPVLNLLMAGETCIVWHRMISSCKVFQELYDQRNEKSWIATGNPSDKTNEFCFFHINSTCKYIV